MHKEELINVVMEKCGKDFASKAAATRAVNAVFDTIKETLVDGKDVTIVGFGTFTTVMKPEHEANNPRGGEKIHVPAHKAPKFKPGKGLKDSVL